MEDVIQYTPQNPMIITSKDDLARELRKMFIELGFNPARLKEQEVAVTEMPTQLAKKYLMEKGYKVVTHDSFNKVIKSFGIEGVRRGKENWYKISDLERVPKRI